MTKKLIIISSIAVFAIVTGVFFYLLWNKVSSLDPSHKKEVKKSAEKKKTEQEAGVIVPLDAFIVNLADPGGKRYLRTTMSLELETSDTKSAQAEIEKRSPQIKDTIIMVLTTKRFEDIQPTEGKAALRDEIVQKLNDLLKLGKVSNLYFTELVVQ
jgi:flagellar protein FliL